MNWQGHTEPATAAFRPSDASLLVVGLVMVLVTMSESAQAQSEIRASSDQKIVHNERPEVQVFTPTTWKVGTKSKRGATVTLRCEPFQNRADPGSYVDGQLRLRVKSSQRKPNWQVRIAGDRTNVAGGKNSASVMAASEDKGVGVLELEVTFLGADVLDLVEGDYVTTVTGTITAH